MKCKHSDLGLLAMSSLVAGMSLFLLGLNPGTAQAQEQTAGVLEEITVTVQRREENLQSTPVAITAYSGELVEKNRIFTMFDLANNTPSFSLTFFAVPSANRIIYPPPRKLSYCQ